MKKALAAFALLCALTSLAPPSRGQTSISPSAGSVVYIHFPGAPTGNCSTEQQGKNESNGDLYICFSGAWLKVGSGALNRFGAGLTTTQNGDLGYDTTAQMWHAWDGFDNYLLLMSTAITPATGDVMVFTVAGAQIKISNKTPVGGGASPFFASGIPTALNGDFLHQDNTGVWRAVTPGVPGRTATTTTEPISWTSGTGDRTQMVSLTNASLVTSAIPQCGVAPAVSNPFTTAWITGAGGAKFTSTVSTLNGIAPATGITYPGNTRVDLTCPDNANYTLLASRAFKAGSGFNETLNADGTVTGNASGHSLSVVLTCAAASASGTAYTCTTAPAFTPASGDTIMFKADVANTGAATLNVNASSAAPVKKQGGGTALIANDLLASQNTWLVYDGTNWQMQGQAGNVPGVLRLDQIISATATNTTANGNFPQILNFAQTTDSQAGVTVGENLAATGGTLTSGIANQSELKCATLTNSTAACLNVVQGPITNTVATPAGQIQCTWNNGSLAGQCLVVSVTNTASSAANSRIFNLLGGASGATPEFGIGPTGNVFPAGIINIASGVVAMQGSTSSVGVTIIGGQDNSSTTQATLTLRGSNNSNGSGTSASNVVIQGGGMTGAATNVAGADVSIAGGLGTGTSTPSHVIIKAPGFGAASGTTAQSSVTRFVFHSKAGSTTTATATNMFNIALANNQTAGARIHVHVETTQATPQNCSTSSEFFIAAQDTAGTVTTNVSSAVGTATICSTGTLTLTLAASAAAPTVISVTPSWTTIVPTAVIITVGIENLSQQDVALL